MSDIAAILGADAARGDPDLVEALAADLTAVAADVHSVSHRLSSGEFGGGWTGESAEAFHVLLHDVPPELDKVTVSYEHASSALSSYADALRWMKATAQRLADEAATGQAALSAANAASAAATRDLKLAQLELARAVDPAALLAAQHHIARATAARSTAQSAINGANTSLGQTGGKVDQLRGDFALAVTVCCNGLNEASKLGIQNTPLSAFNRHVRDPLSVSPLASLLVNLIVSPMDLVTDLIDLAAHPSLAHARKVFEDVGSVVALIGIAALAVAAAPGALIGAGLLATVLLVGGAVAMAADAGIFLIDAEGVRQGELPASKLLWDGVNIGLDGVTVGKASVLRDMVLGAGSKAWATRYIRYGLTGRNLVTPLGKVRQPVLDKVNDGVDTVRDHIVRTQIDALTPSDPVSVGSVSAKHALVKSRAVTVSHTVPMPRAALAF